MLAHAHVKDSQVVEVELRVQLTALLVDCVCPGCFILSANLLARLVMERLWCVVRVIDVEI